MPSLRRRVRGRPLVSQPAVGAWLVLLAGLPFGYRTIRRSFRVTVRPLEWDPLRQNGVNYQVYHYAAEAALAGEDFYAVHPPGFGEFYTYLYPPITVVSFYPFTLVDWWTGYLAFLVLNVLASLWATTLLVGYVEDNGRELGWLDAALIFAFLTVSTHAVTTHYFGNINVLLGVAFVVGFVALFRGDERVAGAAFGLAALYKVFPAIVGLYLLRVRARRALAAAIATGGVGLLLGALVFGLGTTRRFFFEVLLPRSDTLRFVGGYPADGLYYVTIQRPLSYVVWTAAPNAPAEVLVPISAVVAGTVLAYFYLDVSTRTDRLIAAFATVVVTVTLFPSFRMYLAVLYFPLVPLLYLWEGPGYRPFVAGGILLSYTERPASVLETVADYPEPLASVLAGLGTVATVQLWALALMLAGCAVYKRRSGVRVVDELRALRADVESRLGDRG